LRLFYDYDMRIGNLSGEDGCPQTAPSGMACSKPSYSKETVLLTPFEHPTSCGRHDFDEDFH